MNVDESLADASINVAEVNVAHRTSCAVHLETFEAVPLAPFVTVTVTDF